MSTQPLRLSRDVCIAFSDEELACRTYDTISELGEATCDEISTIQDELNFLVSEAFQRFAPHAERAALEEHYRDDPDEDAEQNLQDALDSMRENEAARMLRRALGSERDDG